MSSECFAIFIALPVLYWFHPHLRKEMPQGFLVRILWHTLTPILLEM